MVHFLQDRIKTREEERLMEDKKRFFQLLKEVMVSMKRSYILKFIQVVFSMCFISVFFVTILTRWVVFTYIIELIVIVAAVTFLVTTILFIKRRPREKQVVYFFDQIIKENNVITAYSFIEENTPLTTLQREQAIKEMTKNRNEVLRMIKTPIYWKTLLLAFGCAIIAVLSFLFPSSQMEAAKQLKEEKKIVDEVIESIEEIANQDELNHILLTELQQMLEENHTPEQLLTELLQLEEQLEQLRLEQEHDKEMLDMLANLFEEHSLEQLSEALLTNNEQLLNDAFELLKAMQSSLTEAQLNALKEASEAVGTGDTFSEELTDEQLTQLLEMLQQGLSEMLSNAAQSSTTGNLQKSLQQAATSLNTSLQQAGVSQHATLPFMNRVPSDSNIQGTEGGPSVGQGETENGNTGSGSQEQNPGGQGQGSGQGGQSNGGGGNGAGAGTGAGPREFLTIPERIDGESTIEVDTGELGEGESTRQQSSETSTTKGTIRPYQEAIKQYERGYRESIQRLQLPSHLEGVVKDYFSELNQEGD